MAALREVIERRGRFCALYSDRASHFFDTPKAGGPVDLQRLTQVGRALKELGIQMIPAYSPQARGRGERRFGTWQGRLPQELRLAGITNLEEANRFLRERYIPEMNRKFAVPAPERGHAFVPVYGQDLDRIFSVQQERVVANGYTIRYNTKIYQITHADIRPGLRGATVRVEERRDQTVWVRFRNRYLKVSVCEPVANRTQPAASALARPIATPRRGTPGSTWMKGFDLGQGPPLWKIMRQEQGAGKVGGSTP